MCLSSNSWQKVFYWLVLLHISWPRFSQIVSVDFCVLFYSMFLRWVEDMFQKAGPQECPLVLGEILGPTKMRARFFCT